MNSEEKDFEDNQNSTDLENSRKDNPNISLSNEEDPPKDKWATYQIEEEGEVRETFKVPFTQEELDLILALRQKRSHPGLFKGYTDGGPEREHMMALQIPFQHGLDNRKRAIAMLRQTARDADKILSEGKFTPGLNTRQPIAEIRNALKPLVSRPHE